MLLGKTEISSPSPCIKHNFEENRTSRILTETVDEIQTIVDKIQTLLEDQNFFDIPNPLGKQIYKKIFDFTEKEEYTNSSFKENINLAEKAEIPYYLVTIETTEVDKKIKILDAIEHIKRNNFCSQLLALDFRNNNSYFYNSKKLSHKAYISKMKNCDTQILKGYQACDYRSRMELEDNTTDTLLKCNYVWKIEILHLKIIKNLSIEYKGLELMSPIPKEDILTNAQSPFPTLSPLLEVMLQNRKLILDQRLEKLNIELTNWLVSYTALKKIIKTAEEDFDFNQMN